MQNGKRFLLLKQSGPYRVFSRTWPCSIYANLLEQKKAFAEEKSSTPRGLVWDTNMAAVSLFWDTNMAAVTSGENTLYILAHVQLVQ